jgi:RNA recognition motif-containing protein
MKPRRVSSRDGRSRQKAVRVKIYVGGLSHAVTEDDLRKAFEAFGEVLSVKIIKDKGGESKGFGFVEMPAATEALSAINKLNGTELKARALTVNEARPRAEDGRGGGR